MRKLFSTILAALLFAAQASAQNVRINEGPSFGEITIGSTIVGTGTPTRILFVGPTGALAESANLVYDSAAVRLTVGTGSGTSSGWVAGYGATSGVSALWHSGHNTGDYLQSALFANTSNTYLAAPTSGTIHLYINGDKLTQTGTAGAGPSITAGTAADATPRALSISQTWTDGTSSNIAQVVNITQGTGTGKLLSLQSGASGTTDVFSVSQAGVITTVGSNTHNFGGATLYGDANNAYLTAAGVGSIRLVSGSTTWAFNQTSFGIGSTTAVIVSATAPTLASGGCTTPGAVTANGTAAFSLASVGTSCSGSQPLVWTLPAATTGWNCTAKNVSNAATSAPAQTGAVSTTSVTITNFNRTTGIAAAWTDADVVVVSCLGY